MSAGLFFLICMAALTSLETYGHYIKMHFPSRQVKPSYDRMQIGDDEDPLSSSYISRQVTGV